MSDNRPRCFEDILFRLTNVKRSGNKATADCTLPGHKTPAGHLTLTDAGDKALVTCQGGRHSYRDICQALGFTSLAYSDNSNEPAPARLNDRKAIAELKRAYNLTDATIQHFGIEPDYQKQAWRYPVKGGTRYKKYSRLPPKKYWHTPGTPNQLYGYDDIPDSTQEVYLLNGEPAVWVSHQAGVPAVCGIYGEGELPNKSRELLKAKDVETIIIIPDLDRKEAAQKPCSILKSEFTVKVRELPGHLGEKADACDLYAWCKADSEVFKRTLKELPDSLPIPEKEKERRGDDKPMYLAKFDSLIDIVDDAGDLVYLTKEQDELKVVPSVKIDGHKYLPPPRDQLPYLIPRWKEVQRAYEEDDPNTLFSDLVEYHKRFSELPNDNYYILLAAWDFSTYILLALLYSGYIYLYAVPERGKTKTGQAAIYVAYRGIHQANLREADLFRASEDLGATLFLDVLNLWKRAQRDGSEDILLQRYEKGAQVRRVLNPERGAFKDSRYYSIYGATIIASNEAISHILESRSFPIDMPYSLKNFPKPTPEIGLPFRERLVAWRARQLGMELPAPMELTLGRLNDISTPLWQIISLVSPSHLSAFEELIRASGEKRREERATTIEGEVMKALLELDNEVEDGTLPVSTITEKINEKRRDSRKQSAVNIGRVLRRLNFKPAPGHKTMRSYLYDTVLIQRLACEYGLADTPTPSDYPSQVSQASPPIQKIVATRTDRTGGTLFPTEEKATNFRLLDGRLLNWPWVFSTWHDLGRPLIHVGPGDNLFNLSPASPDGLSAERLQSVVKWIEEHSKKMMPEGA